MEKNDFDAKDLKQIILVELDPEKSKIAKITGTTEVVVYGELLKIGKEKIKLDVYIPVTAGICYGGLIKACRIKEYPYSEIKSYKIYAADSNE